MKDPILEEALNKLRKWCSRQDRSRKEVITKLSRAGYASELIDRAIVLLEEDRYLDESRFAESYVTGHFRMKNWGRLKIRQGLKLKGVGEQLGAKAIEENINESDYLATLAKVLGRKVPPTQWSSLDYAQKQKLMQYAYSRGFEPELIRKVMEGYDYLA